MIKQIIFTGVGLKGNPSSVVKSTMQMSTCPKSVPSLYRDIIIHGTEHICKVSVSEAEKSK